MVAACLYRRMPGISQLLTDYEILIRNIDKSVWKHQTSSPFCAVEILEQHGIQSKTAEFREF